MSDRQQRAWSCAAGAARNAFAGMTLALGLAFAALAGAGSALAQQPIQVSTTYDLAFSAVPRDGGGMRSTVDVANHVPQIVAQNDPCLTPGNCVARGRRVNVSGCLEKADVKIKCNGDGTYTLVLDDANFPGDQITLTSQTPGVTVLQSTQQWAAQTTWTITGASGGQTVIFAANVTKVGAGGRKGTDSCCSGEIKIVMPDCPPSKTGVLKIIKEIKGAPPGIDLSSWQYPVSVSCNNGMGGSFNLAAGGSGSLSNIPFGTQCTVTEDPSSIALPTRGCPPRTTPEWQQPGYSPVQPVTIGPNPVTTVTVSNVLLCVSKRMGTLTIKKTALWDGVDHTNQPLGDFQVLVSCQNPSSQQTITLTQAGGYQMALSRPVGAVCTITEQLPQNPSVLPSGVTWLATPASQTITIQPGSQTAQINNTIVSVPMPSGLRITKTCGPATPGVAAEVEADCQISVAVIGTNIPATIVITDLLQGPINIPGSENKIVSMTSAQNWSCPPMPIFAGSTASCQLPGADLANAGGQSIIDTVVRFHDVGNAQESQNCVAASGLDASGAVVATAQQVCASFPPGVVCGPGTELRGGKCVTIRTCDPPFVANSAGGCGCPANTAQVGKRCLPIISCKAPKVPTNNGTACGCPVGTVENGNTCVKPVVCRPPLVPNKLGQCACPDGLILEGRECVKPVVCRPPLVPNKLGQCACPDGLILEGRECVKPVVCRPPLVPNKLGQCACPDGLILKGRECVKPVVCRPPLVPNKLGQCACPDGLILKGRECVKPVVCRPPLVPNKLGQCACPDGLILKGRECVKPVVCRPPLVPNKLGQCACPDGLILRGRECVKPAATPPKK